MTQNNKIIFEKGSIYECGYGVIAKKIMRDKRITPEAKAIYGYICSFAGSGNTSFPGADLMMNELCMSEQRFYKHRKILIDYGYISIVKNRNENRRDNNTYLITQYGSFESVQNESFQNESVQNEGCNNNSINNNSINNNSNDSPIQKSEQNINLLKDKSIKDKSIYTKEFLEWYSIYPNAFNKEQSFKNFKTLLKTEILENVMLATKNYIYYLQQKGTNDKQYITRSTNFIGTKKIYLGYLEIDLEYAAVTEGKINKSVDALKKVDL